MSWAKDKGLEAAVMQCTSAYPSSLGSVGLNVMTELGERLAVPVGLSDHSGTIFPSLAAAALGAQLWRYTSPLAVSLSGLTFPHR